jgi:hypothetical protein
MMELIYTSSSKGLEKGRQGYCTVACTESMAPLLKTNLENMSGYSWIFSPHDKNFNNNPVNYSFMKVKSGQEWLTVFSRIGLSGLDYSGRPNKIAHYICIEDDDLADYNEYSPSSIIGGKETFVENWEGDSQYFQKDFRTLSVEPQEPSTAYWQEVTGDGDWASYLVQAYREAPDSHINIIYDSHIEPLKLIAESTALLTPEEQWDITFSTYFNGSSLNSSCKWRFILRGSKYFEELKSTKNIIDLNDLQDHSPEVELALPDKWDEETNPNILLPPSTFDTSWDEKSNEPVVEKQPGKESNKKKLKTLSVWIIIIAIIIIICNNYSLLGLSSADDTSHEDQHIVEPYSYKISQELIPKGDDLEKYGDVLISIQTDDFLRKLRLHKKISLDIFAILPEEMEISLIATENYQVNDNVINRLYIKKINGEFVQDKKSLLRLNLSKKLVIESLLKIDQEFIIDFKKNVLMMKVNRIIIKFI